MRGVDALCAESLVQSLLIASLEGKEGREERVSVYSWTVVASRINVN